MLKWIRNYDSKTPVYLCMEDEKIWSETLGDRYKNITEIEKYIIANYD